MRQEKHREVGQQAGRRRYSSRPHLKNKGNRYVLHKRKTRKLVELLALWVVALAIFAAGVLSVSGFHFFPLSTPNPSPQVQNTPPTPIFRVDGVVITDTQWHQAVQSAFSALVSAGQFSGGSQTASEIINTQAMHTILDPIATQEIVKELGLPTNVAVLYHQWLSESSAQEQQSAQENLNNLNYQQQKAQEQLKKDIVAHFTTLPAPTVGEVHIYYVQHISAFARTAPQIHVQQIVTPSLQTAQQAANQLKQGTPFSTVEASNDVSGAYYTAQGGDLGWITLGPGFPPEWTAQVRLLQPGQITAPFLVDSNYYIVKCIEGPDYDPWPFNQVQQQARANLISEQLDAAFAHILVQHEGSMNIDLLDPQFGSILQSFAAVLKKG